MTAVPTNIVDVAIAKAIGRCADAPRIWVGFSGGLDSTVLLHLVAAALPGKVSALHVDHGLDPKSGDWATHCDAAARALGVPLHQCRIVVARGPNLEARAREARYGEFRRVLTEGAVLLLAHHADDQLETMLLRLLRGTDPSRLGIATERPLGAGRVLRPFLDVPRDAIAAVARTRRLAWIEDPSNASTDQDRNYLRHVVLPTLRTRWPDAAQAAARGFARGEWDAALAAVALDAEIGDVDAALAVERLKSRWAARLLRRWLEHRGVEGVREAALEEVLAQIERGLGIGVEVAPGVFVRVHGGRLYADSDASTRFDERSWDLSGPADLPCGVLRAQRIGAPTFNGQLRILPWRGGGERIALRHRRGRKSVARLLQEAGVPAWRRREHPLLFVADTLAVVPGVAVAEQFADQFATGMVTAENAWRIDYDAK